MLLLLRTIAGYSHEAFFKMARKFQVEKLYFVVATKSTNGHSIEHLFQIFYIFVL